MRNIFIQLKPKTFQITCIILCILGDMSFSGYMYHLFSNKDIYLKNFQILKGPLNEAFKKQGMSLPTGFEHEIFQIMLQTLSLMLMLFIIAHLIIYTFYYFQKRFAFLYIRFIAFMGVFGALTFSINTISLNPIWGITFILVTLAYLFVTFGMYYFTIIPKENQVQ